MDQLFKNSVLAGFENLSASITPSSLLISLFIAFFIGLFIYFVYRKNYHGVMFSHNFGLTLVMLIVITTPVVMCIRSSLQLSMGMVGALSIVRFRTAVKDPMDTAYMFWSITMGILLGAGLWWFAIIVVAAISLLLFIINRIGFQSPNSYLLVLHYDEYAERNIQQLVSRIKYQRMRSKTITRNGSEMTIEIRLEDRAKNIVQAMLDIDGVHDATLVSCQNEAAV